MNHRPDPPVEEQDWNQCLKQVAERDRQAFERLFVHFSPRLKGFLMQGGRLQAEQADELVQEAMIKVWRKAPSYAPAQASASTWIYTIARNTRIDWLRKHQREQTTILSAEDIYPDTDAPSPDVSLTQYRNRLELQDQLASLPPAQAEVLAMMYLGGLSGQ